MAGSPTCSSERNTGAHARLVLRRRRGRTRMSTSSLGGTYRNNGATTTTATATWCRTAATRSATGLGKVTFRPCRGPRDQARRDHRRLPLSHRAERAEPGVGLPHQCGEQHPDRALPLQPAGRQAVQFRRQRLLEHDRAGSAQGPERHARAASAIRSPASSATTAASRSTPRASTSTTRRGSTSAISATRSPMAATCSATR